MLDVIYGIVECGYMQTTAVNRELVSLQTICWAPDAQRTTIQNVSVSHRRADICMAEQFLDRSNVVPVLEQMGRKGMERVAAVARAVRKLSRGRIPEHGRIDAVGGRENLGPS